MKEIRDINILAIETSCDETAAAVVHNGREVLSNVISSQIDLHKLYGGVVPEIASRKHIEKINQVIEEALKEAEVTLDDIDAVGVTYGPGLVGALLVGVAEAKAIAYARNLPLVGVHHIEGHISANYIEHPDLEPPFLCLVASGGHTHLVRVAEYGKYEILGRTRDDAAGEAYDKVARAIGLGYPGGPMIEKLAAQGDENRFSLPRPLQNSGDCNLSFSGLKTAVRKIIESYAPDGMVEHAILPKQDVADVCACFQKAATECLLMKLEKAIKIFKEKYPEAEDLVVAGGVAANTYLRESMERLAKRYNMIFAAPPVRFCTDNGVMIAWAGLERFKNGYTNSLDFKPRPRWPLDENAPKAAGAGGVKA